MNIFDENGCIVPDVQDALYEMGNVGLGMASVTIGRMMGVRMHIGIPTVLTAERSTAKAWVDERERTGILTGFDESIEGFLLFLVDQELADLVMGGLAGQGSCLRHRQEISCPEEFGRLISESYLKSLFQYLGVKEAVHPVWVHKGRESALIREAIGLLCARYHGGVAVDTAFSLAYQDGTVKEKAGRVLMLLDEESAGKMAGPLLGSLA